MTNTNPATGIRYGVISGNNIDPDVFNELVYGATAVNVTFNKVYEEAKREFEAEFADLAEQANIAAAETDHRMSDGEKEDFIERWFEERDIVDDEETYVQIKLERWNDHCEIDDPHITGAYEGVEYQITWLGGAPLVWALCGPTTYVRSLCSPCVPNAGDLDSGFDPHGYLTYSVPQDWVAQHRDDLKLFFPG